MELPRESVRIVNEVENVHANDAVECLRGNVVRFREIGDDRGFGIVRRQVQDIDLRRSFSPEPPDVAGILELQAASPDSECVELEESVDIVPVDRGSAFVSEGSANRLSASGEKQSPPCDAKTSAHNTGEAAGPDHRLITPCSQDRNPSAGRGAT
jgi:hypothetical protein